MPKKPTPQLTTDAPVISVPPISSHEEMIAAIGECRAAEIERLKHTAAMNAAAQKAAEPFVGKIDTCVATFNAYTDALKVYLDAHPSEFPKGIKSIETVNGKVGYRTCPPSTELLPKWTWEKVKQAVKSFGLGDIFIRVSEDPDKDAFIAWRGHPITNPKNPAKPITIETLGVTTKQDEIFFVEPTIDEVKPAEQPAEAVA